MFAEPEPVPSQNEELPSDKARSPEESQKDRPHPRILEFIPFRIPVIGNPRQPQKIAKEARAEASSTLRLKRRH